MTSVELDKSSLQGVDKGDESADIESPFLTIEQLYNMTRVDQLRAPTLALLRLRYPPHEIEEAMIGFDLMEDLHFGRSRRSGAEEATHPGMVGLLDLSYNPDLTVDELITDYLHDAVEDGKELSITPRHISSLLILKNIPKPRAESIGIAVDGLTRRDNETQIAYINRLIKTSSKVRQLHVEERKLADATHNVECYAREVRNPVIDPTRASKYLENKANLVLAMGDSRVPFARNTQRLRQAIIGCKEEMAIRGQGEQFARRQPTLSIVRVRV